MDDDWDSPTGGYTASTDYGVATEGGKKFTAGRGFKAVNEDDGWGDSGTSGHVGGYGGGSNGAAGDDNGWVDVNVDGSNGRDHRGGRRGGRGGRGGGRRYDGDNGNGWDRNGGDSYGQSNDRDGERRGGGRGRGRGRGRGGFDGGGRGGGFEDGDGKPENTEEKKREIYVPPERVTDEDLFTSTTITSGVNFMKLDDIEVNVSGENVPPPIMDFQSSGLRQIIADNVRKSNYDKPTPIQKYAIPIIMNGRDLMGCAQTGSGKTAAFLLPIINNLVAANEGAVTENGSAQPNVVIVTPTRELASQIFDQAKKFAYNSIIKVVVIYGGTSVGYQRNMVSGGCHILVATPGRLTDFVRKGFVSYASVNVVVLDEADRMLDMGFLPDIETMLGDPSMRATGERQTLMFSATFPEEIQELAGKFLNNYVFVTVGIVGSASSDVEQNIYEVSRYQKRDKLIGLLRDGGGEKTVVFVETKRNADFLATVLSESDIKTTSIHGDRLQRERETALWDFKKGFHNILVATGVAARGLDIEGIQHVINFDLPKSIDEYVHRIGRTGRVGNRGKATSFFDPDMDSNLAPSLAKILAQAGQEVPSWLSNQQHHGGSRDNFGGRDIRGDDFGAAQNYATQPAEEAEEDW